MADEDSFIGNGWSFPPQFNINNARVEMTSGVEDIRKSLEIIFTTSLGERIMNPKFGCNLQGSQFESMSTSTITYIKNLIETSILYHEPRIDAEEIDLRPDDTNGTLWIEINYKVRGTNSRFNFVYPFYMKEGDR